MVLECKNKMCDFILYSALGIGILAAEKSSWLWEILKHWMFAYQIKRFFAYVIMHKI